MDKGRLAQCLKKNGCVRKVPEEQAFTLKSGARSTTYIDLRNLVAHPAHLLRTAELMMSQLQPFMDSVDYIAGVVAGGIPLSVLLSQLSGRPMLMIRTERKTHGTGKLIEGLPVGTDDGPKRRVMLVEDVVSTGGSVRETILSISNSGENLTVIGCVCAMNRGPPTPFVPETRVPLTTLWTLSDLNRKTFAQRAIDTKNELARVLFARMDERRSNLIWSADIEDGAELLRCLALVAPFIVAVKLHFDAIIPNTLDIDELEGLCHRYKVLIISDRKFADIGATVTKQIRNSEMERTADAATIHPVAGPGTIDALAEARVVSIIVAQMSCEGGTALGSALASQRPSTVMGIVCQSRWDANIDAGDGFVYMTPGVDMDRTTDGINQRYRDCHTAIYMDGCDAVIVGRAISDASTPADAAKRYRDAAWKALG